MAKALATSLGRKLIIADLSTIVSPKLGQTAQNVSSLFQRARIHKAVLFLDEFDSLATERSGDSTESGEMRRVVNSIIQLIDEMNPNTVLIAATNQLPLLDFALVRRFEQRVAFQLPDKELLNDYYDLILERFPLRFRHIERQYGISFAEAEEKTIHQIKANIIKEAEETLINHPIE